MKKKKNRIKIIIVSIVLTILFMPVIKYVLKCDRECVAYFLGGDDFEPIVFQNKIYFPNGIYVENGIWNVEASREYGIIQQSSVYKARKRIKFPWEYIPYLLAGSVWIDTSQSDFSHIYIRGGMSGAYSNVDFLEKSERVRELLEDYSSYIMVNKYQARKNQCLIPKEIIVELEKEFGECKYFETDFEEMKEAFYIYVNPYFQEGGTNADVRRMAEEGLHGEGHYISTIFMDEEGTLYYCNSNNVIEGALAEEIKEVLEVGEMLKE